jgi:thymidylate synthase (FAD)
MRETTPKVWLVASPIFHWSEAEKYLESVGGADWVTQFSGDTDAEALIEFGGRLCYRSWKPGLNANVQKVRENSHEYLKNILKSQHGSVLEHAQFSFVFQDVSRVFTHELVRHRAGVAISQESLRYVRLTDIGFRVPDVLKPFEDNIVQIIEQLEEFQVSAAEDAGLDDDGVPFHYKKEVTSALRRLAPLGLSTSMLWSANVRTLRHVINMRTAPGAEEEIRSVFNLVARAMQIECPALFADFRPVSVDEDNVKVPHWKPEWEKV